MSPTAVRQGGGTAPTGVHQWWRRRAAVGPRARRRCASQQPRKKKKGSRRESMGRPRWGRCGEGEWVRRATTAPPLSFSTPHRRRSTARPQRRRIPHPFTTTTATTTTTICRRELASCRRGGLHLGEKWVSPARGGEFRREGRECAGRLPAQCTPLRVLHPPCLPLGCRNGQERELDVCLQRQRCTLARWPPARQAQVWWPLPRELRRPPRAGRCTR